MPYNNSVKNKEYMKKYLKEYRIKNREKGRIYLNEYRRKLRERTGYDRPTKNNCMNCGKKCVHNCCCQKCRYEYEYKMNIQKWLNHETQGVKKSGKRCGKTVYSPSAYVVRYMQKEFPKCEKCGWNKKHPTTNALLLQIHHKDGNTKNGSFENLEHLCSNCHSLTKNYMNHKRSPVV